MGRRKPTVAEEAFVKVFLANVLILGPVKCYPHSETWAHFFDRHDEKRVKDPAKTYEMSGLHHHRPAARPKSGLHDQMDELLSKWGSRPAHYKVFVTAKEGADPQPQPSSSSTTSYTRSLPAPPTFKIIAPAPPQLVQNPPQPSTSRSTSAALPISAPIPPKKRLLQAMVATPKAQEPVQKKRQKSENNVATTSRIKPTLQPQHPGKPLQVLAPSSPPRADTPENLALLANVSSSLAHIAPQYPFMGQAQKPAQVYPFPQPPERQGPASMLQGLQQHPHPHFHYQARNPIDLNKVSMSRVENSGTVPAKQSPPRVETPRTFSMRSPPRMENATGMFPSMNYTPIYGNEDSYSRLRRQAATFEKNRGFGAQPQQNMASSMQFWRAEEEYYEQEELEVSRVSPNSGSEGPPSLSPPHELSAPESPGSRLEHRFR